MKALKGNMEYQIRSEEKEAFIKDGFDIYDDSGTLIAKGKGKTVTQKEYDRLCEELKAARKNVAPDSDTLLPVLKEYASLKGINIGRASTAGGILEKIKAATPPDGE